MYSYFVGIDIAKNTHWASCLSSDGEVIFEPFSFSNDNSGFQKFISKLEKSYKNDNDFAFRLLKYLIIELK